MKWYNYLAAVGAGFFLGNAVPHFVAGSMGEMFPSPFASPPGVGLSSPLTNVLWGLVDQTIAAANASKQKMFETGEADYTWPIVLQDSMTREEFNALGVPMSDDSYNYYGKDGVAGPGKVKNFTLEHIGDQPMQSLISIAEHYADKITQPTMVIYGPSAATAICSTNFLDRLTNNPEVRAFDEFSHVDFYWKPEAVKASCDAAAEFLNA